MTAQRLYHMRPGVVSWHSQELSVPGWGEALVRTKVSAISAGTEGLFFRGEIPEGTIIDSHIPGLAEPLVYPFRYGYCLCGFVEAIGPGVSADWMGGLVFAFQPHCTAFVAPVETLMLVPSSMAARRAVFFPLVETAATLVLDAAPRWGERVAVFGLGLLGTLVARLVSGFPLNQLALFEPVESRRSRALAWIDSSLTEEKGTLDFDLAFDVGGSPASLAAAVKSLGFGGRMVLGSWQGSDLYIPGAGPEFHRKRLEIISSQVSTLAPALGPLWNLQRRSETVWKTLGNLPVEELISHEWPFTQAQEALEQLQHRKDSVFQVVLNYE